MIVRFIEKVYEKNLNDSIVKDIEFMLKRSEKQFEAFTAVHLALLSHDSEGIDKVHLANEYDILEDQYRQLFVSLESNLAKKKADEARQNAKSSNGNSLFTNPDVSFQQFVSGGGANGNVHLPKI